MRKRTVRNGMRLVLAALIMIIAASFFHSQVTDFFSLSATAKNSVYQNGMFWAAALGGCGAMVTVLGFLLAPRKNDVEVRLFPLLIGIATLIFLFFYLLSNEIDSPARDEQRRVRPGETITI